MDNHLDNIDESWNKKLNWLIYASLMSLALGLFTSMTFLALTHIFIAIPCFYFLSKTNFKKWPMSAWSLLGLIFAIILSVLFNQDISSRGFAPLTKSKYYLLALLSIVPFQYYFTQLKAKGDTEFTKKIHWLLMALLITTTAASLSGMIGIYTKFNPLLLKYSPGTRNGGLAGMLLNYAHNLTMFLVLMTGLIYNKEQIKKYINVNFLYITWVINLFGLYTTYARGALLAFVVSVPFYLMKKNKKKFISFGVLLVLTGLMIFKFSGNEMIRPKSDIERISQWKAAWVGFKERPILGLGYLNFEQVCPSLKIKYDIEAKNFCGHAHSNYFEMLASTGLIGFIFFILWQGFWFVEMYKREDLIARIAVPFIIVFIVGGLTQATFTLGANLFLIMPFYALSQVRLNDRT